MGNTLASVRQSKYDRWLDGQDRPPRANRRGEFVICDFWQQLIFDGRMFHMQIGTESAPVNATVDIDDRLAWTVVDGAAGTTILPALWEVTYDILTDATIVTTMLEIDRAKARYDSGGTAFVPANLRTDSPRASVAAVARVGTDVALLAKTAVPGSIEIGHHMFFEDAIATGTANEHQSWSVRAQDRPMGVIVGVGSLIGHLGCATATNDVTGYGCLQGAELDSEDVV